MNKILNLSKRPKIAVVGSGISGLASAYELHQYADLTIFEAEKRLGGHARTVVAGKNGDQPVDTGFIVFNYANYPHLTRLFKALDVPVEKSNMSFGATIDNGRIEYALRNLNTIFAQRKNLINPKMYRLVLDIVKFGKNAEAVANSDTMTTGELLDELQLGSWFINYYLLPICGAIWSTPPNEIRDFPAKALVQFFSNHALLEAGAQHQWWTVSGGSIEYVLRLKKHLEANTVRMFENTPVKNVKRDTYGIELQFETRESERFDEIIFACHSDEALALLEHPTPEEQSALSRLRYQDNRAILHADKSQMPKNKSCWSSWVYQSTGQNDESQIGVTYWMNNLQNIPHDDPVFVTLNPLKPIDERLIYDEKLFRHPLFDHEALQAQKRLAQIQGQNRSWYTGAYLRHGFHEDGYASAVRVKDLFLNRELTKVVA